MANPITLKLLRSGSLWACLALLGLLPLLGAGQANEGAGTRSAGPGVLAGRVTRGPTSPVQGPGLPPATAPAAGVKLLIYGPERQEITSVLTDKAGQYRVNLPPGDYLIELAPIKGRLFTKELPARITISPGRETLLNLRLDTGLRRPQQP